MSYRVKEDLLAKGGLCVGCRISRGQLLPAGGFARIGGGLGYKPLFAGYSRGVGRFFICDGTSLYVSVNGQSFSRLANSAGVYPFLIEEIDGGAPRAAVINGGYAVAHTGDSFTTFGLTEPLRCGVMHCGRLFGICSGDGYRLRWSGEGGAEDWSDGLNSGGYLVLDPERGEVYDILEYGEKLVLVRKFGLTIVSMFGSPENFSVELTDTRTDEIYARSARVAGGRLLFYTSSGLRSYAGGAVTHVSHGCGKITRAECSAEYGGIYYLGGYSEKLNKNAVLRYDPESGEGSLIDIAAEAMCAADGVYVFNIAGVYRLEDGGGYTFTADYLDFGVGAGKTLTSLNIGGRADVEVDNGRAVKLFRGAHGVIRPRLRGKSFTVRLTGSGAVSFLTAEAEVMNEI